MRTRTDNFETGLDRLASERDEHSTVHLQRRVAVIQWFLPILLFFAVLVFEVTEHKLLGSAKASTQVAVEILFFGTFGPTMVWWVIHWLRNVLTQQIKAEQVARWALTESNRLNQQMTAIQHLSTSLASSLDLREVLDSVLPDCLYQIGYSFSAVLLIDESARALQFSSVSIRGPNISQAGNTIDQSHSMLQYCLPLSDDHHPAVQAVTTGQSTIANGLQALMGSHLSAATCEQIERAHHIRSIGLIPLQGKQKTIGVLAVGTPHRALTLDGLMPLISFANQSAAAIENAQLYKALQHTEIQLRAALEWAITAQEDERKRIARELHDETAQALVALGIGIETAETLLPRDSKATQTQLAYLKKAVVGIHSEIKRIILDLRPTLLDDLGLMPAISWYAEEWLSNTGITVHIEAPGQELVLPPLVETMLFRVAQEAINNIVRHSQASQVEITLLCQPSDGLQMCIRDNGCGFNLDEIQYKTRGGVGLMGIRERWAMVGGAVEITSEVNKGTTVSVHLQHPNCGDCPYAKRQADKLICECPKRWKKQSTVRAKSAY